MVCWSNIVCMSFANQIAVVPPMQSLTPLPVPTQQLETLAISSTKDSPTPPPEIKDGAREKEQDKDKTSGDVVVVVVVVRDENGRIKCKSQDEFNKLPQAARREIIDEFFLWWKDDHEKRRG